MTQMTNSHRVETRRHLQYDSNNPDEAVIICHACDKDAVLPSTVLVYPGLEI
jgi:hypothetical protein